MVASWAPWHVLLKWQPFKIDALGLVTLLGSEEINAAVGRLVRSKYLEHLPLLGAYVIAGDRFTEKAAGWNLYNITQGIHTTDLAAWLTRWMLSQDFETTRNFVVWKVTPPQRRKAEISLSFVIGFIFNGFLIAGTILSRDWYGFANALAMIASVVVRVYILWQQRKGVDDMIDKAVANPNFGPLTANTYEAERHVYKSSKLDHKKQKAEEKKQKAAEKKQKATVTRDGGSITKAPLGQTQSSDSNASSQLSGQPVAPQIPPKPRAKAFPKDEWTGKLIKVLIIQSDSKAVTFWMPNQFVIPPSLFIDGPTILNPKTYFVMRSIGWLAFAVHIVAIGMADLATQLYTVLLIVLPTILLVQKTGCDDSTWGETFTSWKNSLLHESNASSDPNTNSNAENAIAAKFTKIRECWIGSRLKAEIYEWPESFELLREEGEGKDKKWIAGRPAKQSDRSKKRQDLYAWLSLTQDEEDSMDKWDLFPHIRKGNNEWWKTYKLKKHAIRRCPDEMGLRGPPGLSPPRKTGTQSSHDSNRMPFRPPGRTATVHFLDSPDEPDLQATLMQPADAGRRGSIQPGSSAFPAGADTDTDSDDDGGTPQTNSSQVAPDIASQSAASVARAGAGTPATASPAATGSIPVVNTSSLITTPAHLEPGSTLTQSPTITNATVDQP